MAKKTLLQQITEAKNKISKFLKSPQIQSVKKEVKKVNPIQAVTSPAQTALQLRQSKPVSDLLYNKVVEPVGKTFTASPNFSSSPVGKILQGDVRGTIKAVKELPAYYNKLESDRKKLRNSPDPKVRELARKADVEDTVNVVLGTINPSSNVKKNIGNVVKSNLYNVKEVQAWKSAFKAMEDTRIADKLNYAIKGFDSLKKAGGSTKQFHNLFDEASQFLPDKVRKLPVDEQVKVWKYIGNRIAGVGSDEVPKVLEGIDWMIKPKTLVQNEPAPRTILNKIGYKYSPRAAQAGGETYPQKSFTQKIKDTVTDQRGYLKIGAEVEPPSQLTKPSSNPIISQFDEASDRIAKQVNPKVKRTPVSDFVNAARGAKSVLKEKLVDSFSPIEDFINQYEKSTKIKLSPTQDPRLLRNRVLGSEGIGRQMLKKTVEPALKSVGVKNLDEFDRYLAARHALDVNGKGIETGIDTNDARVFTDALRDKYEPAAQAITNHTQQVLKYVKDAGIISQELYDDLIKKYPNYVPLNRVMDEIDNVVSTPNKAVGSLSKQTVVQKLKGSKREINSPLENIVNKTMQAVDQAERNRVAQGIVNLRKLEGMDDIIKPAKKSKIFTFVDENGETQTRRIFDRLKDNEISVYEDGVHQVYEVPEDFARAAKNLDKAHMDVLTRVAAFPVRVARMGITGVNLPFIATNVVRDQLFSILTSTKAGKTSIAHPFNFIKAFLDTAGKKGAYDEFIAAGGGSSNFYSVGRGAQQNFLKDLARSNKSKIARTITNPTKWLSAAEDLVGVSEQGTRTQQFLGTKGKGVVDPFAAPTDDLLRAVQAGRENTVDFAKKGAYGQVLNSVFIYLNAGIQGSRTALRSFKKNPISTSAKLVGTVYTPVAVTTLWNNATPERQQAYKDIPDYEKQNNIIILPANPVKDENGRYAGSIKIPLPQTYLGLAVPIRSAIEHLVGSGTDSIQDVLLNTLGKVSPVDFSSAGELSARVVPTAIAPAIENLTNTKLFTGQPIVPRSKQDLKPAYQTGSDTTQTAKFIGEKFNISPAKLENLVRGYTGDVGMQVLNAVDQAMAKAGIIDESQVGGTSIFENIMKRFTKTAGGKLDEEGFQKLQNIVEEEKTRKYLQKEEAKKILNDIESNPNKIQEYINKGVFTEDMQDLIKKQMEENINDLSSQERYLRSQSNAAKSTFILDKIKNMNPEDVGQYVQDLRDRKIISANVEETIMQTIMGDSTQSLAVPPEPVPEIPEPKSMINAETAPITQSYGNYNPEVEIFSGGTNYGTDFGVGEDTELSLPEGVWEVVDSYDGEDMNSGYGKSILVENRKTGERIRLSHLNRVLADKGELLRGGSTVGFSGNTGNSTGPHVDVEYYDQNGNIGDILRSKYARNL